MAWKCLDLTGQFLANDLSLTLLTLRETLAGESPGLPQSTAPVSSICFLVHH
jgi:hypothetical protein